MLGSLSPEILFILFLNGLGFKNENVQEVLFEKILPPSLFFMDQVPLCSLYNGNSCFVSSFRDFNTFATKSEHRFLPPPLLMPVNVSYSHASVPFFFFFPSAECCIISS